MTPYVELQTLIIRALFSLAKKRPDFLRELVGRLEEEKPEYLSKEEQEIFKAESFFLSEEDMSDPRWDMKKDVLTILLEQIAIDGDVVTIRDLLGFPLEQDERTETFYQYAKSKGNGANMLRTVRLSQPKALRPGDVLASGCRVLEYPREGGNGTVLIKLTGGHRGSWIGVPGRIPIALLTQEDDVPEGYVD